ncbi:MAG TPA: calcium-translocating P-type ATPase, SERCA-type [Clostridiaceae bacterium]|nr:calcium-translocating P-type ATPase, SERCA-type [Clostridiaceae bacterium]
MHLIKSLEKNTGYGKELASGISEKEAKRRINEYGPNIIIGKRNISAFKILLDQFSDFMVIVLLVSTAISAFMGEMTEAFTIIAIVIINAIMGFIQEYRTEKTLEALKELTAPTAKVIRDNKHLTIPAEEIVPGDLILLEAGDRVPADSVLLEAVNLQVDESLLTGESVPVEKYAGSDIRRGSSLPEKKHSVYMGTVVTMGRASAIVYATGMNTEMGKIAHMIHSIEDEQTPLQKKLDHLGKLIVYACLTICAIVSVTGILRGENLFTMLLSGISLAVAAVPEGLPAIVTISLALGVQRMMKRNALVRKLPAVETLGCANVICSDKTGTLTENKMTVRKVYTGGTIFQINDSKAFSKMTNLSRTEDLLKTALEIGALCNNSSISSSMERNGIIKKFTKKKNINFSAADISGDPTEIALLVAASKYGITESGLKEKYMRIGEIPFDSERKCMSVICRNNNGESFVFTKGAPDIIINKCTSIYMAGGIIPLTSEFKKRILNQNEEMAREALRVLGVAYKKYNSRGNKQEEVENNLIFVGLIGMIDPPRKEAAEAVMKCKTAGIKTVMITGDHKTTATTIAQELGIYKKGDLVLTGSELDDMDDIKLQKIVENVSVYARVTPAHKLMIVRALKRKGLIVAMTGDGVNDAPAIKESDIGISMGLTGTDVTKEASSMILMDDNFATIVAAIEEGRVIYSNIRKFIRYLLACNIGEVLTMFLGMLLGLPIPLMPIQVLWVNLVTDGLPAMALGLEPAEKDIMMRSPRSSKSSIFSDGLVFLIILRGILLGLSTLAVFVSIIYLTRDIVLARTSAFMTLVLTQLTHVFECKSERKTIFEIPWFNNIYLVLAVMCSLIMMLVVVYIPPLQVLFKTTALSVNEWLIVGGFTFLGPVVSSFIRFRQR